VPEGWSTPAQLDGVGCRVVSGLPMWRDRVKCGVDADEPTRRDRIGGRVNAVVRAQ
jgi:hypothetical protein